VVAPSGRASGPCTLRRLNVPRSVEVRLERTGVPVALRRNSGWLDVVELLDRYRTEDRWWTERPVSRAYYELLLEDGRTITVFQDELEGSWYEQKYG